MMTNYLKRWLRSTRRRIWPALIVLSSLAAAPLPAPDISLPLSTFQGIASSFGEYRTNHMHAGLDFSTGGKNGMPVLATADGEIRMVKITYRGYGRALYLYHPDGTMSVYAHLQGFCAAVEARIAGAVAKNPYPDTVEITPPVAVKRGDIVAYSGESGEGYPHLHYELRKGNDPVNFAGWIKVPAQGQVRLTYLHVIPASPSTSINGRYERVNVPLPYGAPLQISGPFTLAVQGMDLWEGRHRGLQKLELSVDGAPTGTLDFSQFDFTTYRAVRYIYEKRATHFSPSLFSYFLLPPGNSPFVFFTGPPRLELSPGTHHLEIKGWGMSSNASNTITVRMEPPKGAVPPARHLDFFPTHFLFPGQPPHPYPPAVTEFKSGGTSYWIGMAAPNTVIPVGPYSVSHSEAHPIPMALWVTYTNGTGRPNMAPELHMEPKDLGMRNKIKVSLRLPGTKERRQVGFYRSYGTTYFGGEWEGDAFAGLLFGPDDFQVLRDDRPPSLGKVSVSKNRISLTAGDRETGIPWNGVQAEVGGKSYWIEYDPDHSSAVGTISEKGAVTVRVSDGAGNTTVRKVPRP
jgi:hypothetical protein